MWNHSIECYADLRNNVREQELFKSGVIGNTMKNRIKRNTKRIKRSHAEENWMQRELHSQNQEGSGSTKMSKGSKRRPKLVSDKQFQEAWDNIFVRKVTPKHRQSKVHRDKSKYNRNEFKRELQKDDFQ